MQIVSNRDNLHEMSNPVSWKQKEIYFTMSSTEVLQCIKYTYAQKKSVEGSVIPIMGWQL